MRIVFIGSVEFSRHILEYLLTMDVEIVGVCTLKTSKFNTDHVDLSVISKANKVPYIYADDINSTETLDWIKKRTPDIIFCFGWSKLLVGKILSLSELGVVGFHPSALPSNRGRHPLIWALVLGLEKTASTFFFMDDGADSGDILSQCEIVISNEDDARSLYDKVISSALGQINEFVPQLVAGTFKRKKQDYMLANTWRKRGIVDGKIDWRMSAHSIYNLVRGLSKPYVGAHFIIDGQEVTVWETEVVSAISQNIEPGKVLIVKDNKLIIKCGEGAISLLNIEPAIEIIAESYL
jgi:methionyl-tRNA formyltransferase